MCLSVARSVGRSVGLLGCLSVGWSVCLLAHVRTLRHLEMQSVYPSVYVGTMCDREGSGVSVVEDDGTSFSEATATHELGHR